MKSTAMQVAVLFVCDSKPNPLWFAQPSVAHATKRSAVFPQVPRARELKARQCKLLCFLFGRNKKIWMYSALLCKNCNVFPPRIGCFEIAWLKGGNRRYGYSHNSFAFFNLMANKKCFAVAKHFAFVIRENFCIFPTTGLGFCTVFCVVDTVRANAWHYESKTPFFPPRGG